MVQSNKSKSMTRMKRDHKDIRPRQHSSPTETYLTLGSYNAWHNWCQGVIPIVRSLKFSDFVPPPPYVPHCSFCLHPHPFVNVRFRLFPPSLYRNFWWLGDEFANFLYRNDTKTNFVFGQYPPPHLTLLVFVRFFAPSPSPSGRTYYLNDPLGELLFLHPAGEKMPPVIFFIFWSKKYASAKICRFIKEVDYFDCKRISLRY